MSRVHEFRLELPDPVDVVFDWHRRPGGLARLLPPWQPIRIIQEAGSLRDGTAVLGLPAGRRWVARHLPTEYVEERTFADQLTSRPFLVPVRWHHRHDFRPSADGCVLTDQVTSMVPDTTLRPMFDYRQRQLTDDLAAHRQYAHRRRLTIAITGSSGLVGSALAPFLTTGGHRVVHLVRRPPRSPDERHWEPLHPDPAALEGVDALVHLAGAPIAGRFTEQHQQQIRSSRVEPTRLLAEAAAAASVPVFVSASAIGFYGADRGGDILTEGSEPGDGFLADVVRDWERAARAGEESGSATRSVQVRTGIVQSPRGGALRLQRPLFAAGLGGPLAGGDQWVSWIGIDDLVDVYLRAILDEDVHGPINAVAPHPVRQRDYAATLGRVMGRPAVVPTPRIAPRLLLGATGEREVAAASQRVDPAVLLAAGHAFRFPELEQALRHLLGKTHGVE
jgi:uncharacterized protein (TIGR01777 family)